MEQEQGKWEDIIRSKIYDFEADTSPDDWDIISGKLPSGGKTVTLNPYRRYSYAAAAAVAALLIVGGLYFYQDDKVTDNIAAVEQPVEKPVENVVEKPVENSVVVVEKADVAVEKSVETVGKSGDKTVKAVEKPVDNLLVTPATNKISQESGLDETDEPPVELRPLLLDEDTKIAIPDVKEIEADILLGFDDIEPEAVAIDKPLVADASQEIKRRRWGFGMGGGGYTMNSTSGALSVGPYSMPANDFDEYIKDLEFVRMRSSNQSLSQDPGIIERVSDAKQGKVKHKMPISAGLGASYYLNDRWSLQSGVVYTLLRSEGNAYSTGSSTDEWKQNLHFVGVPLSLSYKIAEWKRLQFYASAGGTWEINVAGKLKKSKFEDGLKTTEHESLRMKESLWSVNARAGVAYPLWKFINVYAETGASYYFENNSKIETIRSDKPFNVSLQAGIRLGF